MRLQKGDYQGHTWGVCRRKEGQEGKERGRRRTVRVFEMNCEDTSCGTPYLDAADIVGILGEQVLHQL